jgi:hypothetical protein
MPYFISRRLHNPTIVATNPNGVFRARKFQEKFAQIGIESGYVDFFINVG